MATRISVEPVSGIIATDLFDFVDYWGWNKAGDAVMVKEIRGASVYLRVFRHGLEVSSLTKRIKLNKSQIEVKLGQNFYPVGKVL